MIPVFIANTTDPLPHDAAAETVTLLKAKAERLLWYTPQKKVVVLPLEPAIPSGLLARLGFGDMHILTPQGHSRSLCVNSQNDAALFDALHKVSGGSVRLVAYANSPAFLELIATFRAKGFDVHTPETPDSLWLGHYIDSKIGFRAFASTHLPAEALPEGFICHTRTQVVDAVRYLEPRGAVIKPNWGQAGRGIVFVQPGGAVPMKLPLPVVVEEFIRGEAPSVEFLVREGQDPIMTYACEMIITDGHFQGVYVSASNRNQPWYAPLESYGYTLAHAMQQRGFVGVFDVDATQDGRLLEMNIRRTGGTHVHELATQLLGEDYATQVDLLSHDSLPIEPAAPADVLQQLDSLLYPINGEQVGIIPTILATTPHGTVGLVTIGPDRKSVQHMMDQARHRLGNRSKDI